MSVTGKYRRRKPAAPPAPKPLAWYWRAVNWAFAKLPLPVRLFVLRLKLAVSRWWLNPSVHPDNLGKRGRFEHRPARIALSFDLHADGSVLFIDRFGHRHEWVDDVHLVGLVHREYRRLVDHGYKVGQLQSAVAAAQRTSQASNRSP